SHLVCSFGGDSFQESCQPGNGNQDGHEQMNMIWHECKCVQGIVLQESGVIVNRLHHHPGDRRLPKIERAVPPPSSNSRSSAANARPAFTVAPGKRRFISSANCPKDAKSETQAGRFHTSAEGGGDRRAIMVVKRMARTSQTGVSRPRGRLRTRGATLLSA